MELDLLGSEDAYRRLGLVKTLEMELVGNTDRLRKWAGGTGNWKWEKRLKGTS